MKLPTYIKLVAKQFLFALLLFSSTYLTAQNLFINEFLASNNATIADESGDYEDWIEIYNAGTAAINLAEYYITDDPTDLTAWQIPATNPALTTVPAGGYLILWADKDPEEGAHHVDIKLGAGGESVVLVDPDGTTIIDQIDFGPQSEDVSFGRETDGAANFIFFSTPTPLATNMASATPTTTINLSIPINSADDDGEEFPSGVVVLNSADIEMVQEGSSIFTSAFRFKNIPIPEDAVITNAYLQFYAEEVQIGMANLNIVADAAADAPPLLSLNNNISSREVTGSTVNWLPAPWPVINANGLDQQTPDLSSIVQEVVDHTDWESGNSIAFIFTGTGTRTTYSYNNFVEDKVAVLHIEAEVPLSFEPVAPIFINEVAANGTTYEDASGTREDWIELYNPNPTEVNIGGLFLTDDFDDLDKWQIPPDLVIPAGGFLTFFADDDTDEGILHTNFKLRGKGEEVALVQLLPDGLTIIDEISFEDMPFLASYGRETDGGTPWKFFGEITPTATNEGALLYLETPEFSLPSGVYSGPQNLSLSHPNNGANIYYTTDGSFPDDNSTLYTSPININTTSSIRAIAALSGYENSQPNDQVYQVDDQVNMPVLHLTTDPDNFFDDEIGIYVDGTNGIIGSCSTDSVNWAQDWERPCNLKLFMPDGTVAFDVNAGVEISGACSRRHAMKSLAINLREKIFGDGSLKYELFPQREMEDYQRFKIRGSGQDYNRLGFRDMLNQTLLFKDIDIEVQAGQPALLYLNGEFWGIYNLREKYAGEHFEELYGVKEKDLDVIKSPGLPYRKVNNGSDHDFNLLFDFVEDSDMNSQTDYDYFDSQVDVNEFMNYWIAMSYMANYDWPANNLTIWRDRVNQTKWRYGVADTDGSTYNFLSENSRPDFNTFLFINDTASISWPNHRNSTLFLRKLLEREEFRDEFLQRSCTFMEVIFNEERTHPLIDSIVGIFQPNVQRHLDKWGSDNAMGGSESDWNQWIDFYKEFWETRPDFMRQHMNDFYDLNEYYNLTINVDAETEGAVYVNTNEMSIPFQYTGVYYKDLPLRLTAVAKDGFSFAYWLETGVTESVIDYVGSGDAILTPIFISDGPIFTCPSNINLTVFGASQGMVTWAIPSVSSVCTVGGVDVTQTSGPISGSNFPIGSTTITYEATDGCNNTTTCSFDVIVVQNNGILSLNCPAEIQVDALPGSNEAIVTWDAIATTTCGLGGVVVTQIAGPLSGSNFPIGSTTITYEAVDDCNNLTTCSFYVIVLENNGNLSFNCPTEIEVDALSGSTETVVNWITTGTTTCGLGGVVITQTGGPQSGELFPIGTTTVSYQAVDDCGNQETCTFSVIVNENPETLTITCPPNQIFTLPAGASEMNVSWPLPTTFATCEEGVLNENCGSRIIGFNRIGTFNGQDYFLSQSKKPWTDAQAECENLGGYLAVIGDAEENQFLWDNIDAVVHIGLNDQDSEGTLEWINGASISYTNYVSDLTNSEEDDYGNLQPWDGKWDVFSDLVWKYYLMEIDCSESGSVTITQTGGPENGSELSAGDYTITYTASDDCGNTATCSFTITILEGPTSTEYCDAEGTAPWQQWISNVTFNNINNDSGKDKYGGFTDIMAEVDAGSDYDFSVTASFSWEHWDEYVRVWIDYNGDLDFEDDGEMVLEQVIPAGTNGTPTQTISGTIFIPVDAQIGSSRMRVAMQQAAFADPCETYMFGEVEDYTILINASASQREALVSNVEGKGFTLFPNPAHTELFIDLKEYSGAPATIQIFDARGGKVAERKVAELPNQLLEFDLSTYANGLYLVSVQVGKRERMIGRLVVSGGDVFDGKN